MEIRQLRYFIAVADTLNFSRAADSVYLSQSALSRQIMELEKEIGVPLLTRSTRQVELTDAGRLLQTYAKEYLSRWEKILPEVRKQTVKELRSLSLTIGVDARALENIDRRVAFMEMLFSLRKKHPGLRILIRNYGLDQLLEGLRNSSLDCAFILDRELDTKAGILQQQFFSEEMVLAFRSVNAHDPIDYADVIMNRGLILVDQEPQGLYHIIKILGDLGLEPQIRFCEDLRDMTMTVETGESAMIVPDAVISKMNNPKLQIMRLPTPFAKLYFSMLWPKNSDNPMLPILRDSVVATLAENEQTQ